MKNIKLIILYFIFCFLGVSSLKSQNNFYEKIHDDVKFDMVPELEQKAQEISNLIEVNEGSSAFKVLSAEEYFILGHQNEFDKNQFSSTVSNAIGSRNNFLLFQKYFIPIDGEGINKKYTVHYNVAMFLPPGAPFATNKLSGIQNGIIKLLQSKMDSETGPQLLNEKIAEAELEALEYFKNKIECLIYGSETEDCSLEIELLRYKFRKFDIQVGEASAISTFGEDNIFDYFGKKVLILGIEGIDEYVDIADQIRENKKIIDAGFTVTNEDTTLFSNPVSGRVFILTADQFINNGNGSVWDGILNTAGDYDYTECWVILENNNGKTELYSKFTIGQFSGSGIGAVRDDGQGERSITPSPWGLALKALGNAALYACMEAVTNRLTDEKINDWGAAFGSVSIAGAAWEGVSSLIPWKKTKLDNVMIAISNGLGVVIEKASKGGPNYTVQNGLSDFLTAVGSSLLTQWLGPKVETASVKFTSGVLRLGQNSSNGTVKKVVRKFGEFVCFIKGGCFDQDTYIQSHNDKRKINEFQPGDFVLCKKVLDDEVITASNSEIMILDNNYGWYDHYEINSTNWGKTNFVVFDYDGNKIELGIARPYFWFIDNGINNPGDSLLFQMPEFNVFGYGKMISEISNFTIDTLGIYPTENYIYQPVITTFKRIVNEIYNINFDDGSSIDVTGSHLIYSKTRKSFIPVSELNQMETILTSSEKEVRFIRKELKEKELDVYNLEIYRSHHFYACDSKDKDGILFHNDCLNGITDAVSAKKARETFGELSEEIIDEGTNKSLKSLKKLTWPELLALFKRGNDFNTKAKLKYKYNEITLTDNKRLDSYIPGQKIISRKATDIDNISEVTWHKYCKELVTKYKAGKVINSKALPQGSKLSGEYYLEIPALSNQNSARLQRFKDIAATYGTENQVGGIKIIFLAE